MTYTKKWMRVTEAAEYVSKKYGPVSVSFIRQLIQKRAVTILRVGHFKLVEASDLDAYIQKHVEEAASMKPTRKITIRLTPAEFRELKTIALATGLQTMGRAMHHCLNVVFQGAEVYSRQPRMNVTPVPVDLLPPRSKP